MSTTDKQTQTNKCDRFPTLPLQLQKKRWLLPSLLGHTRSCSAELGNKNVVINRRIPDQSSTNPPEYIRFFLNLSLSSFPSRTNPITYPSEYFGRSHRLVMMWSRRAWRTEHEWQQYFLHFFIIVIGFFIFGYLFYLKEFKINIYFIMIYFITI
jgi:hypothetical protein